MNLSQIDKNESNVLKAFAIIAITFHNFLHLTNPIGENEMSLAPDRFGNMLAFMGQHPWQIPDALFSYFGHYGVEIFIFVSGYGLAKQFSARTSPTCYGKYLLRRTIKLYSLLLCGICACFFLYNPNDFLYIAKTHLTMTKNFTNETLFTGVGPWWYFSLALQLYIIFPILYQVIHRWNKTGFAILLTASYALIYFITPLAGKISFPVYGNFIGHLPEFTLGIGLACIKNIHIRIPALIVAGIVFVLSNLYEIAFPFSFMSITLLSVCSIHFIYRHLPAQLHKWLLFIGETSMFIFIINGPLRNITRPFFMDKLQLAPLITSMCHFAVVLLASYTLSLVHFQINSWLRKHTKLPL